MADDGVYGVESVCTSASNFILTPYSCTALYGLQFRYMGILSSDIRLGLGGYQRFLLHCKCQLEASVFNNSNLARLFAIQELTAYM